MTRMAKGILWWTAACWACLLLIYKPGEAGARKYLNLGAAYHQDGRTEEALLAYQDALDIRPHLPSALSNMAAIYMETGKTFLAETLLEEAIEYHPKFANAYINLAVIMIRQRQWVRSLELLDSALAIEPNNFTVYLNRGEVLGVLKRPCETRAAYDQAYRMRPDVPLVQERKRLGERMCPSG